MRVEHERILNKTKWDEKNLIPEHSWGGVAAFNNPIANEIIFFPLSKSNINYCVSRANRIGQEKYDSKAWSKYSIILEHEDIDDEEWPYVYLVFELAISRKKSKKKK